MIYKEQPAHEILILIAYARMSLIKPMPIDVAGIEVYIIVWTESSSTHILGVWEQ